MPAPQQFNDPSLSGVGLYYVPQGETPNIAAEFLSNYLRTRLPTANAVFQARLAAAGDNGRYKQIADLVKARNDLLEQLATDRRTAARISADQGIEASRALQTIVSARVNERGQDMDLAVARTAQATELAKARQVRSADAKNIIADVKQATNDIAVQLGRGADPTQTLDAYRQRLADAQAQMNRAQLDAGERDAIRDQLSTLDLPIAGGGAAAMRSMLADHFPPSSAPEIGSYGAGGRADLDALGQAAIGFAQGARAGGVGGGTGGGAAASSGAGGAIPPEYETQLRRIDALIEELRNQDPTERLGGFFDPLPVTSRRKPPAPSPVPPVRSLASAALSPPPPAPTPKKTPASEVAKELLPDRAPTSPRQDAAKASTKGSDVDQADKLRASIRQAVAAGRPLDTRETLDAAEPASVRNPLLDELLYNGVERDPNLEHNTPRGFSAPAGVQKREDGIERDPNLEHNTPQGFSPQFDQAAYNDLVNGILDDLDERESEKKRKAAGASRRR